MIEILNIQDTTEYKGCELLYGYYDVLAKLPENATNGDMIKAIFSNAWISNYIDFDNKCTLYIGDYELEVDIDWWNAPYKGSEEE